MAAVEAEAAVRELRDTYAAGKTKSFEWRISQLKAIQQILTLHSEEIIGALRSDLKKPEFEAVIHEISVVSASCKLALKELHRWMKPQKVKTTLITFPSSAKIVSEPFGVVLVISAWNFPFALSVDPVIGAIAAGNAVVLKPSENAPATSSLLAKLVGKYMDASAVKVVEGAVPQTTALLDQKWDKILYTGGSAVGRIVLTAAAKHLTPVILELGGKCPAVVDSKINLKVAARRIIAGKWGCNNGQACISPDYLITTKDFVSEVVNILSAELEKFFGEEPLQSKELSSIVNSHHFNRLVKLLDDDEVSGKIVCGGERDKSNLKIAPTIILGASKDSLVMKEEIFGPILPIITVDKIEECFGVINAMEKPLAAYLFTNDKKLEEKFVRSVSAGGMIINDTILHFLEAGIPFGGIGESGMGAYHGKFSFDAFSHKKPLLKRSFAIDISARYPPYTPGKRRFLRAVVQGTLFDILRSLATCW
ncbi:aldehyde dehydrogenase-like [Salvia miltiorrhiza]|uniref:aldehyde dehydrogenase-like n=1 Tax=Salvia miltiorrhiza TaxID=226208 RepID=UPI0025AB9347|nr:aldehyde dehydrogenase-like [Salvia miltiorrhiza]